MADTDTSTSPPTTAASDPPVWTYPTRFCRICREDVPATVTMYPPGIPMQFQRPVVEYRNEDEYGRLLKPCMCRGSSRYIHELCLLRSRTENNRKGSMWKCHECGHQFSFQRLRIQRWLSSWISAAFLTILFMVLLTFFLGFIADPIINICMDPYDSFMGHESIWDELEVRPVRDSRLSAWSQHFAKGFISMGLVGFAKSLLLNPLQYINLRWSGGMSSRTTTSGRNRAVNVQWVALVIGLCSAFAFFYRWVQAIMQRMLVRLGNNIVDTRLPGDDDDLKPPPGWKHQPPVNAEPVSENQDEDEYPQSAEPSTPAGQENKSNNDTPEAPQAENEEITASESQFQEYTQTSTPREASTPALSGSWISVDDAGGHADDQLLSGVHRQGWSFANL